MSADRARVEFQSRELRGGEEVPVLEREPLTTFVHIESI
jgi:hypothetical protein